MIYGIIHKPLIDGNKKMIKLSIFVLLVTPDSSEII